MHDNATEVPAFHSTSNYTGDVTGAFTTTIFTTTTTITTTTTTMMTTTIPRDGYSIEERYDEGVFHLVAVISSLVVFVGLVLTVKSVIGFLRRLPSREHDLRNDVRSRPGSSFIQWFRDEPPPYPGKYSRTNVNYLPSYQSAIEIERQRQSEETGTTGNTLSQPARGLPEVGSEHSIIMFTVPEDDQSSVRDSPDLRSQTFGVGSDNNATDTENLANEASIDHQTNGSGTLSENSRLDTAGDNLMTQESLAQETS